MAADHEKFRTAYDAWQKTTKEYWAMLDATMAGTSVVDRKELAEKITKMKRQLDAFTAAGEGIVFWKW